MVWFGAVLCAVGWGLYVHVLKQQREEMGRMHHVGSACWMLCRVACGLRLKAWPRLQTAQGREVP